MGKYFTQKTSETDESGFGFYLIVLLAGAFVFAGLFLTAKLGLAYVQHANHYEQAEETQGVLIERIRIPRHRQNPEFYLRYKYENETARHICSVDFETKLTPKDRACKVNIDRIEVNEAAYRAAKVPSKLDILYLPNQDISWSQVEGHSSRHTRSLSAAIISLIVSLFLGVFTFKAIRLL